MRRVLALIRRRPAVVGAASTFVLLAAITAATPGAFGAYSAKITNSTDTAASATYFKCTDAIAADKSTALFQWPLNDTGMPITDVSGNTRTGTHVGTTVTDATTPLACPRDAGTTWSLDGTSQYAYFGTQQSAPTTFTIEVWFKTSVAAGKLIGFGSSTTGVSASYDRHLYIGSTGTLIFGVFPNAVKTISSTAVVTDNTWHYAAATLSPTAGMSLYLDGKLVASDGATTTAQVYNGYWRVGYDAVANWTNAPTTGFFKGRLRYAAVSTSALTAAQIQRHYAAGV